MPNKELKEIEKAIKETRNNHTYSLTNDKIALACMELVKKIMGYRSKSHIMKFNGKDIEVFPSVQTSFLQERYKQIRSQQKG